MVVTKKTLYQAATLLALAGAIFYFGSNAATNLARQHIASGFSYLRHEAGFGISESIISYAPSDSFGRVLLVGLLNTLRVALLSCALATCIGAVIGVFKLSTNQLLSSLASIYVDWIRNTPLLLQLFLWYALVTQLPSPRAAVALLGTFISNKGLQLPAFYYSGPDLPTWVVPSTWGLGAAAGFIAMMVLRHPERVRGLDFLFVAVTAPVLLFMILSLFGYISLSLPELSGFDFVGGVHISPEFFALAFGLTMYGSAFIAEIVRTGILAVPRGQREASFSLGLGQAKTLRFVIFPQALRIVIPPMITQYANIVKDSSLAVAIGYPDLVSVSNTTMNRTGQAVESIFLFMLIYFAINVCMSLIMTAHGIGILRREQTA